MCRFSNLSTYSSSRWSRPLFMSTNGYLNIFLGNDQNPYIPLLFCSPAKPAFSISTPAIQIKVSGGRENLDIFKKYQMFSLKIKIKKQKQKIKVFILLSPMCQFNISVQRNPSSLSSFYMSWPPKKKESPNVTGGSNKRPPTFPMVSVIC